MTAGIGSSAPCDHLDLATENRRMDEWMEGQTDFPLFLCQVANFQCALNLCALIFFGILEFALANFWTVLGFNPRQQKFIF